MREPIVQGDSRKLRELLPKLNGVNCIVTSPPYYDLLEYGHDHEIGTGSGGYGDYLHDLRRVFSQVHQIATEDATCWVIIDGLFKIGNQNRFLPADFSRLMEEAGWTPIEVVIWEKNKNRPWSGNVRFRNRFEFILIFAKDPAKANIDLAEGRTPHGFEAKWFAGWPERYGLLGRAPSDVWSIDIPDQGSWSEKHDDAVARRHLCPFPVELVARILEMTTRHGHVVLDPFAGSGVVPYVAQLMGRKGFGVELVPAFVDVSRALHPSFKKELEEYRERRELERKEIELEKHELARLRMIKAARVFSKELRNTSVEAIFVQHSGDIGVPIDAEFVFVSKKRLTPALLEPLLSNPYLQEAQIRATFRVATASWLEQHAYNNLWVLDRSRKAARGSVEMVNFTGTARHRLQAGEPLVVTPYFVRRYGWKESPFDAARFKFEESLVSKALSSSNGDAVLASRLLGISLIRFDAIRGRMRSPTNVPLEPPEIDLAQVARVPVPNP